MKNIIISMTAMTFALTACNSGNNRSTETKDPGTDTTLVYACPMHPEITGKKGDNCSICGMKLVAVKNATSQTTTITNADAKSTVSIKEIMSAYLQLKNALTKDNSSDAASSGTMLEAAFKNFDKTALTPAQKNTFEDIADDAIEHAEHIGKNGGKIAHQREHFKMLSDDIYDLVKAFGGGQPLYKDFCPMYNDGKGAFWLSETKEIKNPYFGKGMSTCGEVKEEMK